MNKYLVIGIVVILLLVGAGYYLFNGSDSLGAAINCQSVTWFTTVGILNSLQIDGTSQVGSSGTALTRVNAGTCYIRPYAATITATSTAKVDCQATASWSASGVSALTGVTAGDFTVASLATSTAGSTFAGVHLIAASASTTSGYIELTISNLTGTTFTWPVTGTASGTASYIVAK